MGIVIHLADKAFEIAKTYMMESGAKIVHHTCHKCNYKCNFFYNGMKLYYDSGCHCTGSSLIEPCDEVHLKKVVSENLHLIAWLKKGQKPFDGK